MTHPKRPVNTSSDANDTLALARAYLAAGLSLVPILRDGSKHPLGKWKQYQKKPPGDGELRYWFDRDEPWGVALVCGEVSGGLEVLDFDADADAVFGQWRGLVEEGMPGLFERLCVVRTPRWPPGYHALYRHAGEITGNDKIAARPDP